MMEQNKFKFRPFDRVLVRDSSSERWHINFYSHLDKNDKHVCMCSIWNYCIPYNTETAHLLGTTEAYTPPQPKTYQVVIFKQNGHREQLSYTDDEFKKFIKIAVLNNKDVSNFDVRRICG